jgi:RHS repeat-associated protein
LPPEWGQLIKLSYLGAYGNQLSGNLPPEWGQLTQLQFLYLDSNQLSGPLPVEWGSFTQLQDLFLENNQLTGALPSAWGQFKRLKLLQLNGNQLSGSLPSAWSQMAQLSSINLSYNQLSGPLPAEWRQLTSLGYLDLLGNQLSGPLPSEWSQLPNLGYLDLSYNQLSGTLPADWWKLKLSMLYLGGNELSGALPPEWGQLAQLRQLNLSDNKLTGALPPEWGQLAQIQSLLLNDNQLAGTVPSTWRQPATLVFLELSNNQLTGPLPATFLNKPLYYLSISGNRFTSLFVPGTVPSSYPTYFGVASNQLDFSVLESLFTGPGQKVASGLYYSPQTLNQAEQSITATAGKATSLTTTIGGAYTQYQWQRQVDGYWQSIAGATSATYTTTFTEDGIYRCKAINRWVVGLTLSSPAITVTLTEPDGPARPYNFYNALSQALKRSEWDSHKSVSVTLPRLSDCGVLTGGKLFVQLDSGPSHSTGKTAFTTPQVVAQVTFSATNSGGIAPVSVSRTFSISQDSPEMQAVLPIPADFVVAATTTASQASDLTVAVQVVSQGATTGVQPVDERLSFRVEPEYFIRTLPQPSLTTPGVINGAFENTLSWSLTNPTCDLIRNYQLQVLHKPVSATSSVTPLESEWAQQGLLLETGSSAPTYRLTLAQGEGTYHWRVRAIGNLAGGVATPANWGPWSGDTNPFEVKAPNEKLNWIYSRTFSEGGRVAEKLTFANGLQQVRQIQTRLANPTQDPATLGAQTIATQIIQDYSGRDAVTSLPIPLPGDSKLGYKLGLLTKKETNGVLGVAYNAEHFDADNGATVLEPLPADERNYYSSTVKANNDRVPDAEGYPFTRKAFANDGTGRVAEQGGVGQALRYQTGTAAQPARTVRTDYTDVAPAELIRLFGPEAPEVAGAYKIVTTDPNGVASVTYQTKEGQTIATALSRASQDSTLLLPLASIPVGDGFPVKHTITGQGRIIGKPLVLTEPTTITIDYSVTPNTLAASCPEFYCATCDYQVKLRIINAKGLPGSASWDTTLVVPSSQNCSPTAVGLTQQRKITLVAGAYRIERELVPLSYYPLPAAASSLTPVPLASHLLAVQQVIDASTHNGKWQTIRNYLDNARLADLYAYLDQQGFALTTAADGTAYYTVPMNNPAAAPGPYPTACVQAFKIPKLPLSCAPAVAPGSSYADELLDKVAGFNHGVIDFTLINKYYVPNFDRDKFNTLVDNLLSIAGPDQARLDQVRNCWVSLLANLQAPNSASPQSSDQKQATLLDDFLECTGLVSMTTPVSSLASFDLTHAYEQFVYDPATAKPCFYGAYAQYARDHNAQATPPDAISIADIINAGSTVSLAERIKYYNYIYRCLKGGQTNPSPVPQTVSSRDLAEAGKQEAEAKGRSACDTRRTEFQAAIIEQLHRDEQYVVGDVYQWALAKDANGNDVMQQTTDPLTQNQLDAAIEQCQLDIMVQELVNQCKQDCILTVVEVSEANGKTSYQVGTAAEIERLGKAMFNRIDLNINLTSPTAACNTGAGYAAVPKLPGNSYQRVELTDAATSIINYISQVFEGSNRLMAQPNRQISYTAGKPGFQEEKYYSQSALQDLSNLFAYRGTLLPMDFPWSSFEPYKSKAYPLDTWSRSIRLLDDRNISNPRPSGVPAFRPATDFLLLWTPYPTDNSSSGEGYLDTDNKIDYGVDNSGNQQVVRRTHYVIRFTDVQSGQPILKSDISKILQVVTLVPPTTATPNYADPFSSEAIQVRLRLTNGTLVDANVDAQAYNRTTKDASGQYLWPNPDPSSRMILWKSVGEVCTSTHRDYTMCYRWAELDSVKLPAQGVVFTNAPPSCAQLAARQVQAALGRQIADWEQREADQLTQQYQKKCVALENQQETFTVSYQLGYYHYTLYYFDRGGNLMKTIPPAGVVPLTATQMAALTLADRSTWPTPVHQLPTTYTYNSLHQLISQQSPDGGAMDPYSSGATQFYYNSKGQLRFSQNAKQRSSGFYSYTNYDALGRVLEVGESNGGVTRANRTAPYSLDYVVRQVDNPLFPGTAPISGQVPARWQITRTFYSQLAAVGYPAVGTTPARPQRNLQNRVSYTEVDVDGDLTSATAANDRSTTYYSYDAHGNVEWLCQNQPGLGSKYVRYEYDLISNKVLKVLYQEGQAADQFYHRYAYDGDNRLTEVYTSADNVIWDRDAHYEYYAHGPLKRLLLGEDQVQGVDYTYTLQGWLKGINHPSVDPGGDGVATTNAATAGDAFGMALGYFPGDYKSNSTVWSGATASLREPQAGATGEASPGLYNGNIATWTSHTRNDVSVLGTPPAPEPVMAEQYRYDQLNRLVRSHTYAYDAATGFTGTANYHTGYSYDANGNLQTLGRNGYSTPGAATADNQLAMDALRYSYKPGTNQLVRVDDDVVPLNPDRYQDIRPASSAVGTAQYTYDAIGNLVSTTAETGEGTSAIAWNVYGKITQITQSKTDHNALTRRLTNFRYDAQGQRIAKAVQLGNDAGYTQTRTTYYVRDAQGNVLATYEQTTPSGGAAGAITLLEQHLYGSSRLGVRRPGVAPTLDPGYYVRTLSQKQYELTDHLGNVRAVVSDTKLPQASGAFQPELLANYNYYPFGQLQPNRYNPGNPTLAEGYRYGYNGKEKDNNGELGLTTYDYGFRIYNPGLGKFLSVDPLTQQYPWLTPYQFAGNTPIQALDLDGKEVYDYRLYLDANGHRIKSEYLGKNRGPLGGFNLPSLFGWHVARVVVTSKYKYIGTYQFAGDDGDDETANIRNADKFMRDESFRREWMNSTPTDEERQTAFAKEIGDDVANGFTTAAVIKYGQSRSQSVATDETVEGSKITRAVGAAAKGYEDLPFESLSGKSISWIKRQKPRGWRTVAKDNGLGWKWLDASGNERLIFQRPSGQNATNSQWARMDNGYFRWLDEYGNYMDVDGNAIKKTDPQFNEKTHIRYEGTHR